MIKKKLKEWFRRYAFAELIGIILVLIFSNISMLFLGSKIVSGFIGTWSDNLGFYGTILYKDIKKRKNIRKRLSIKDLLIQLRDVLIEFGPAEYLDSFIIRPAYLIFFPYIIHNYSLAIIIGTI